MAFFTSENMKNVPNPTEKELYQKRLDQNRENLKMVSRLEDSPYRTATIKQILETYPELN